MEVDFHCLSMLILWGFPKKAFKTLLTYTYPRIILTEICFICTELRKNARASFTSVATQVSLKNLLLFQPFHVCICHWVCNMILPYVYMHMSFAWPLTQPFVLMFMESWLYYHLAVFFFVEGMHNKLQGSLNMWRRRKKFLWGKTVKLKIVASHRSCFHIKEDYGSLISISLSQHSNLWISDEPCQSCLASWAISTGLFVAIPGSYH